MFILVKVSKKQNKGMIPGPTYTVCTNKRVTKFQGNSATLCIRPETARPDNHVPK